MIKRMARVLIFDGRLYEDVREGQTATLEALAVVLLGGMSIALGLILGVASDNELVGRGVIMLRSLSAAIVGWMAVSLLATGYRQIVEEEDYSHPYAPHGGICQRSGHIHHRDSGGFCQSVVCLDAQRIDPGLDRAGYLASSQPEHRHALLGGALDGTGGNTDHGSHKKRIHQRVALGIMWSALQGRANRNKHDKISRNSQDVWRNSSHAAYL